MGAHDRYCVGPCDNDKRLPEKLDRRNSIEDIRWHKYPVDQAEREKWDASISKGRQSFTGGKWTYVCSIHFVDGKPTSANPTPTLFLTQSDFNTSTPTRKRKRKRLSFYQKDDDGRNEDDFPAENIDTSVPTSSALPTTVSPNFAFENLSQEYEERFYTGFIKPGLFKTLFCNPKKSKNNELLGW